MAPSWRKGVNRAAAATAAFRQQKVVDLALTKVKIKASLLSHLYDFYCTQNHSPPTTNNHKLCSLPPLLSPATLEQIQIWVDLTDFITPRCLDLAAM